MLSAPFKNARLTAAINRRVCANEAELAAREDVPWAARDPATQAACLIYGTMQVNKVGGGSA
jgi:hypothetical protein